MALLCELTRQPWPCDQTERFQLPQDGEIWRVEAKQCAALEYDKKSELWLVCLVMKHEESQ